jgi:hypothetical protein
MSQINPSPIILKDVVVTLGADTFERQVSQVVLTPNVPTQKWRGMAPGATYADVGAADWDATITLAQDHETAGSLSDVLFAREGQKDTLIIKPRSGSGPSYQAVVTIVPPTIGGQVGAFAEASVTMPVDGKPTRVVAGGLAVPSLASPVSGGIAGGTMVQITGSNFAGATGVTFGATAVPAADWVLVSPSLIVAKAPAQAAGSKPVKVTNASGASTATAPYTYV